MKNKVINSLSEGSESRIYQQMELLFREQHLPVDGTVQRAVFIHGRNCSSDSSERSIYQQMELLLRQFREQHLPVDGTVQRAVFISGWNCCSYSSESGIYQLLRQFREQHVTVDGTVAQTFRREAFTSRWNCCSGSSESSIDQRRGTKYVRVLFSVAFHGSKPRMRPSLKLQNYIKSAQKFLFQNFSCIECRIQAKYETSHKILVLQFSGMPYSFKVKNCR